MALKTQAFRFIVSGGISAVVDFGILAVLQLLFGLPVRVARGFSFIAGTATAYMINRRWTFKAEKSTKRFLAVVVLYAVTFGINVGLQGYCDALFNGWGWNRVAAMVGAFVIAQGVGTTINFVVQRLVIFRVG
jgi:Predicted membrane protein